MTEDAQTGYLLGQIIPRRQVNDDGKRGYDTEQLLIQFRPMVDAIVYQLGKSTFPPTRKAVSASRMPSPPLIPTGQTVWTIRWTRSVFWSSYPVSSRR